MDPWVQILLPFTLVLGRVSGFFVALPVFSWKSLPVVVRGSMVLLLAVFVAGVTPPPGETPAHWLAASLLLAGEVLCGLGLGVAARLVYSAVQQGALMATQQMGFADAGIINPDTGESDRPASVLFEMTFAVLFLSVGGHLLLLRVLAGSFDLFPAGSPPDPGALADAIVLAGSTGLQFALRMAAPVIAGFLILAVVLGVLARVLPEMNVLIMSFPLRVAVGLLLAKEILPFLDQFTADLAGWMETHLLA